MGWPGERSLSKLKSKRDRFRCTCVGWVWLQKDSLGSDGTPSLGEAQAPEMWAAGSTAPEVWAQASNCSSTTARPSRLSDRRPPPCRAPEPLLGPRPGWRKKSQLEHQSCSETVLSLRPWSPSPVVALGDRLSMVMHETSAYKARYSTASRARKSN